jgi:adenylate cyclase
VTIQNVEEIHDSHKVYYTYLSSGEDSELPAVFTLIKNDGKVEVILFEIPEQFHQRLPDNQPAHVRFHID